MIYVCFVHSKHCLETGFIDFSRKERCSPVDIINSHKQIHTYKKLNSKGGGEGKKHVIQT